MNLLEIADLQVSYPNQALAVAGVSLQISPGERLGLVGESGCGKSTLGRAILRLLPPHSQVNGQITFAGEPLLSMDRQRLRRFRGEAVGLVFQDPMTRLDPLMTIGEHCRETLLAHRPQLSRRQAQDLALATLEAVRIPASRWSQYPHEFSGGMRQRVAIALALLLDPRLIIADEPTTSLDVTVAAEILREMTKLCQERDMALVLISHDLALVGEYCDRIAVMQAGQLVETGPRRDILRQPQHPYTQSLLQAALHLQAQPARPSQSPRQPLLELRGVKQYFSLEGNWLQQALGQSQGVIKAVDGIDLQIYPQEILALVGESGCGKSTLSRTILQLIRPTAGTVEFAGQDITKLSKAQLRPLRRQIQMIFQDPYACLNPLMTIGRGIADPLLIHGLTDLSTAETQVLEMLERVGLGTQFYNRYPNELSGGQQQRVAIARALITRPQLIICDEPVSMLDASIQAQVLDLMLELKQEFALTYLFITHDLWVAKFLADRIAVMEKGKIVEIGPAVQVFAQPQHPYTQRLWQAVPNLTANLHRHD